MKVRITATETVKYEKVVDVDDNELSELQETVRDKNLDTGDFGLSSANVMSSKLSEVKLYDVEKKHWL